MMLSYEKLKLDTLRDGAERVLRQNFPTSAYIAGNSAANPWWKFW